MLGQLVAERVTVGQGVPAQWEKLLALRKLADADLSSLRLVSTGASRVPPSLVNAMRERLRCPVVIRYASTEVPLCFGTDLADPAEVVAATVGRPLGDVEVKICSEDGGKLPTGVAGRILLRSRASMRGRGRTRLFRADRLAVALLWVSARVSFPGRRDGIFGDPRQGSPETERIMTGASAQPSSGAPTTAADVMQPAVTTVEADAHLGAAAYLMKHAGATALVVVDDEQAKRPVGLITDADIAEAVADGKDVNEVRIHDLMTTHPTVITATTSITDAARSMVSGHYRHLPVVGDAGLIGMVDIEDVCRALLDAPAG